MLELSLRKEHQLGKCLHVIELWDIFLRGDQGGGPIVGGAIRGLLLVLCSLSKQAEQVKKKKQASKKHPSMDSASAPMF